MNNSAPTHWWPAAIFLAFYGQGTVESDVEVSNQGLGIARYGGFGSGRQVHGRVLETTHDFL